MRTLITPSLLLVAASFSARAAVDSGLLALVPSGTKIMTSVDIERARSSNFGQYLLRRLNSEDQSFQQLVQKTGFDPRRDLQDFLFASPGPTGDNTQQPKFAILARGSFDQDRIKAAAQTKGAVIQTYQGVDMFVNTSGRQKTGFAFPDVGVAVLADVETLQQIIGNRANPTVLEPELQQLISKAGTENDAWFVSLMPGSYLARHANQNKNPRAQQVQALQAVTESSGGLRFGSLIQLSFDAITRSEKDASALADVVRFLASFVQMQRQKDPHAELVASALDTMNLKTDGAAMHLGLSLPEKNLEQFADEHGPAVGASHSPKPTTR
jgi:hypothetical protein